MRTSKDTKKSSAESRMPRISTRGYYDLRTGATLKKGSYVLYPSKFFENLRQKEFTIMVHGMRNDTSGALAKFKIAKTRLAQLGYGYPVVGFSYDSNVYGAHLKSYEMKAVKTAKIIAEKNGKNLAKFILDFKRKSPQTRIRLMGHSLGSVVILHALRHLAGNPGIVECVYFFGSSIPAAHMSQKKYGKILQKVVRKKIVNYYSLQDDVLEHAYEIGSIESPLGYCGYSGRTITKYTQRKVQPKNHRFASYVEVLDEYP